MLRKLRDRAIYLTLNRPNLDQVLVRQILERHQVQEWFWYSYTSWKDRWHVWWPVWWSIRHIPHHSPVLETGCGCGWNLLWLAANNFSRLYGFDIDTAAVAAGNEVAQSADMEVSLWCDDALYPEKLPLQGGFKLILALNWTYHVPVFDLSSFLTSYATSLAPGGRLIIDVIEKSYDSVPNNRYLTSDWTKPKVLRRPSEYIHRYSALDMKEAAISSGFQIETFFHRCETIPRTLYILRHK